MQDRTLHGTCARNRQNPALAALDEIKTRCDALLETFPETLRHTGIGETVWLLLEELDTIDRGCIAQRYEHSRDTAPYEPDQSDRAEPDPTRAITDGASFDDLPLAQVAFALACSSDSRTGPGPTRISLHGQRFYDHARGVLGTGAVELVCHWFNCSTRDAVRFLETDETLIPF